MYDETWVPDAEYVLLMLRIIMQDEFVSSLYKQELFCCVKRMFFLCHWQGCDLPMTTIVIMTRRCSSMLIVLERLVWDSRRHLGHAILTGGRRAEGYYVRRSCWWQHFVTGCVKVFSIFLQLGNNSFFFFVVKHGLTISTYSTEYSF